MGRSEGSPPTGKAGKQAGWIQELSKPKAVIAEEEAERAKLAAFSSEVETGLAADLDGFSSDLDAVLAKLDALDQIGAGADGSGRGRGGSQGDDDEEEEELKLVDSGRRKRQEEDAPSP